MCFKHILIANDVISSEFIVPKLRSRDLYGQARVFLVPKLRFKQSVWPWPRRFAKVFKTRRIRMGALQHVPLGTKVENSSKTTGFRPPVRDFLRGYTNQEN